MQKRNNTFVFYSLFIAAFVLSSFSVALGAPCILKGRVVAEGEQPLAFATVYFEENQRATRADAQGNFLLKAESGSYTLVVSNVGFKTYKKVVELSGEKAIYMTVLMEKEVSEIDEVEVKGHSIVSQINTSAYNVEALDATLLHNTSMDLSQALDKVSGVNIRTSGGVGSDNKIALNGFSGKHVKIFMDGVPLQGSGSSMGLGKIPITMADRIEVYKGVVPVEFGVDALGGAINIVTRNTKRSFVDASYSYGSFNTHKSNINLGKAFDNGLFFQVNAYQNYSDNNYKVFTQNLNIETITFSKDSAWYERFHDTYHNEAVSAKVGVKGKAWADRLSLEMTYSQEYKEIQTANIMRIVYGGKETNSHSIIPVLNYMKRDLGVKNLDLNLTIRYSDVTSQTLDTLARQYNWEGEYFNKTSKGEGNYTKSEYANTTLYGMANLKYSLAHKHYLLFNHVFSSYQRKNTDVAATAENSTAADFMKRTNRKNVSGLSYMYQPSKQLNATVFGKYYQVGVTGPINTASASDPKYELDDKSFNTTGYGAATTYILKKNWQLKASYEHAVRLPSENELFGDNVNEVGDASLSPENSDNMNLNVVYEAHSNKHFYNFELGGIYRDTKDYIRRQVEEKFGGAYYTNHGKVRTLGADVEFNYNYDRKFMLAGNFTYQEIRNMERYGATGRELIYYKDRMPNEPYLFGNIDAGYNWFELFGKEDMLMFGYTVNYVHDFFRSWESEGGKIIIPGHTTHDLSLNYAMKKGRYNITLEARNMTDELVYDNYSLQKPGRNFAVKFRYFFNK
ncbi:MAG: TonB-dependent receptor domain-containing protein [Mangrovibacterium sp.]